MYKKIISSLVILCLYGIQSSEQCGPNARFSLLAPCQDTCQRKASICIRKPGCYCIKGFIKDENCGKCIRINECPKKNRVDTHHQVHIHVSASQGGHVGASSEGLISFFFKSVMNFNQWVIKWIWKLVTFDFGPFKLIGKVIGKILDLFKGVINLIISNIVKLEIIKIETIAHVVRFIDKIIGGISNFIIDVIVVKLKIDWAILKTVHNIIDKILFTILRVYIGILVLIIKIIEGIAKLLRLKSIANLLGLSHITDLQGYLQNQLFKAIDRKILRFTSFLEGVVNRHKDFFLPILSRIFKTGGILTQLIPAIFGSAGGHILVKDTDVHIAGHTIPPSYGGGSRGPLVVPEVSYTIPPLVVGGSEGHETGQTIPAYGLGGGAQIGHEAGQEIPSFGGGNHHTTSSTGGGLSHHFQVHLPQVQTASNVHVGGHFSANAEGGY